MELKITKLNSREVKALWNYDTGILYLPGENGKVTISIHDTDSRMFVYPVSFQDTVVDRKNERGMEIIYADQKIEITI